MDTRKRTRRSLFATVCDGRDILSARRLFVEAAARGRWKGDFALLCMGVEDEELEWFRSRGVLVRTYGTFFDPEEWSSRRPWNPINQVCLLKYHLFTGEFRDWDAIVYMDTDVEINGSIAALADAKGFRAVRDPCPFVYDHFIPGAGRSLRAYRQILRRSAFNSGILAFTPDLLPPDTYERLVGLTDELFDICRFSDQSIFNLLFGGTWKRLPAEFNCMAALFQRRIDEKDMTLLSQARVVHFAGKQKASSPDHPRHDRWLEMLELAESTPGFSELPDLPERINLTPAPIIESITKQAHKKRIRKERLQYFLRYIKRRFPGIWSPAARIYHRLRRKRAA